MGKGYKYQNLYAPQYSNFNMKLIASAFLAVIALSLFASLVAADGEATGDALHARIDARVDARSTGGEAGVNASTGAGARVQPESRRALDAEHKFAVYGLFRSRLAHYIVEQCFNATGMDKLHCFERILTAPLPAELREGAEEKEASDVHEREFRGFGEFAKRIEHGLAARACVNALSVDELKAAYVQVQSEVEPKLTAFANAHADAIASMPASAKVELQTSANGTITVPKAVLAHAVLVAEGKDSALAQKCKAAADEAKAEAKERFETAKQEFKDKLRELKELGRNATAEEKNTRLFAAINALIDARISAAEKFQAHGASNESVSAFVASMQAKKIELANSTFEQRKALLHEINDEWHAFVRATVSGVVTEKIQAHALRLKAVLAKARGTIDQLKASGKDVTKLEALYVEADAAVTATQEQNLTMREAVHRTAIARVKVMHLVKAVNAVLNNHPVPEVEASAEAEANASAATAPDSVQVNTSEAAEGEAEA